MIEPRPRTRGMFATASPDSQLAPRPRVVEAMRAVLALALISGCSYFATEGPRPPPHPTGCNLSAKPVAADAVLGAIAAVAAGVVAFEHASTGEVVAPIALAGVFGTSAAYGAVQVHRCRTEHAKRPGWSLAEMPAVM